MNNNSKMIKRKRLDDSQNKRTLKMKFVDFKTGVEDTASFFNEIGIMYLHRGQNVEAKGSFANALKQEKKNNLSKTVQCFPDHVEIDCEDTNDISCGRQEAENCEDTGGTSQRKLLCNYRVREYDEGMHVYTNAFHIENFSNTELRTVSLLYNIGQTCVRSKQYEEAKRWFELALKNMKLCEHLQNATSVNIVNLQHNIGHCYYRLGNNKEAMVCYEEALVNVGRLCLSNLDLAAACNCVAVVQFHERPSDPAKSLELFQLSLSIYRTVVGESNREVGTFLNNIGRVYYMRSELDQALSIYQEAMSIRRQTLGSDSIDVAATVFNTGQTYHELGNLDKAIEHYKAFLAIACSHLGPKNCDVVAAYKCIGKVFSEKGDLKSARSMFEQALQSERAVFGEYHPELGSTLNDIGSLCYEMKDMDAALKYFQDGLKAEKLCEQPNLSHAIITLLNIAHIHKNSEDYNHAFQTYKEARALQAEVFGNISPEVACTLSSMGLMQYLLQDYALSLEYYQEALQVRRDWNGSDEHLDIASTLNSIGLVFYKLKKNSFARDVFMESMRIRQTLLGVTHTDVAILWYNVATVCLEMGDEEQAIKSYNESLRLERATMGQHHPEVAATLQHLGQVHQQRGELDEAIKYFSEALEIERNMVDGNPTSICKLLNLIGNIHLMRANVDGMMKCYIEATRISYEQRGQEFHSLVIAGHNFYGLSKLHPACASAA